MSEEQLKAFLEKVKGDTSLKEKLKAAADADAVVAIAREVGFLISADELTSHYYSKSPKLVDLELESAAGAGATNSCVDQVCTFDCPTVYEGSLNMICLSIAYCD